MKRVFWRQRAPRHVRGSLLLRASFVMAAGAAAFGLVQAKTPGPSQGAAKTQPPAGQGAPFAKAGAVGPTVPVGDALPPTTSSMERTHLARLDAALAPLYKLEIPEAERAALREAVRALDADDASKARAAAARITIPAARKFAGWYRLRAGHGSAKEVQAFLAANPSWPDHGVLKARLETSFFDDGGSPEDIISYFKEAPPTTGLGLAALAAAHLARGDEAAAKTLAVKAWRGYSIPASRESAFLARFGRFLSPADHKWRFDWLLAEDPRWKSERAQRAATARRLAARLAPAEKPAAEARLAIFLKSGTPGKALNGTDGGGGETQDFGLLLQRAQALRRAKRHEEAARLLLGVPLDSSKIANPDGWWSERRGLAYELLNQGKAKLAYAVVRETGGLSINPAKEQAFMAGWIALRFLGDREAAHAHFKIMRERADGPLSRAKAEYWLGRTAEAAGDAAAARQHYAAAAVNRDTFHGLLARQRLEPGPRPLALPLPAAPTAAEAARFTKLDAVQAAVISRKAGLDASVLRTFLFHLAATAGSEAEAGMAAHLANALGDTQTGVRIAKSAIARGQNLYIYSYPIHAFPTYKPLRPPPEAAFLLGVARQETEFNTLTVSGAGAKGLLQVMAVTAQHVCQDYRIRCELSRLLTDKPYNAMLASAYIGDRMEEFSGSYVLALAGYNAGPGRAREWIRTFGDPRDPNADPIDWIERIPFQETREYVTKVLSNIQIYRARLGDERPLRLTDDLQRGVNRPSSRTKSASGG